jgi:hypothetical protein
MTSEMLANDMVRAISVIAKTKGKHKVCPYRMHNNLIRCI